MKISKIEPRFSELSKLTSSKSPPIRRRLFIIPSLFHSLSCKFPLLIGEG
jgi:hypothetical protein